MTGAPRSCQTLMRALLFFAMAGGGIGCALHRHTIDFRPLTDAERIVVRDRNGDVVKTLDDPVIVRTAVRFIQQNSSGWEDPLRGPLVPQYLLQFFYSNKDLGGYGIGRGYIVSNPTRDGFWSKEVSVADTEKLAKLLDVRMQK